MPTPADRPRKTKPKRPHLPAASGAIGSCNTRSTPSRSPCPHCSTAPRPTTPSTTTARARTSASPSPCSTSCPHFPIPACAGSARRGDLQRGQRRRHRGDSPRLCAVLPAVTILSGPFAASSRPVEVHARRQRNCGRRPKFSVGHVLRGGASPSRRGRCAPSLPATAPSTTPIRDSTPFSRGAACLSCRSCRPRAAAADRHEPAGNRKSRRSVLQYRGDLIPQERFCI